MKRTSEEIVFCGDLFKEFGDPAFQKSSLSGSKYSQGVRCYLNPDCRKVNTPACDLAKCMRRKGIYGSGLY